MKKGSLLIVLLVIVLLSGIGLGVFYFYYMNSGTEHEPIKQEIGEGILKNYAILKIFYPTGDRLEIYEKKVSSNLSRLDMADILIKDYLAFSGKIDTGVIPEGSKLNSIFVTPDNVVYIDFNRTFKRNFRGDATDEFMLLKSIYYTIMSNLEDIKDVVILIDGKLAETVGGHFFANIPLGSLFTQESSQEAQTDSEL